MGRAWLLTGRPAAGKTTCLRRALDLIGRPAGGFFTEEVRAGGVRVGFALATLAGERGMLADARRGGEPRVGKYGVDVAVLERIGIPAVRDAVKARRLVVIDEIGKMEMVSEAFRRAVEEALAGPAPVLGTILAAPHPWADRLKALPSVTLLTVTPANRDALPGELARAIEREG